jgi:MinD-like ATPase involved in chromosome partitioning or flagellar assembly
MPGRPLTVLTAVTGTWEAPLVAGLERSDAGVRVVRRCVDLRELLSAAGAGLARAVLLSADLQRLDREAVMGLLGAGIAVIGLVEPGDVAAGRRLRNLGVQRVLPADAPAEDVAAAVAATVELLAEARARPAAEPRVGTGDPGDAVPPAPPAAAPPAPEGDPGDAAAGPGAGRVVAVWGPTGAPGRTTVAVTLAAELAAREHDTLLVDADTYGASVAQALGLLDESAGLAAAARLANQGALDLPRLATLAPLVTGRLRVLTGLPQPRRWPELRVAALDVVWEQARCLAAWVVVDCGFGLELDEELSFDTAAPRRNSATLSALQAADVVVAVGGAEPVGLQRLVRGLADLGDVVPPGQARHVVVNRLRGTAVGGPAQARVRDALGRFAGVESPVFVPDDRPACDAAMLAGRSLTEHAPSSPARIAIARLAAELTGTPGRVRRPRRRWRRGAVVSPARL